MDKHTVSIIETRSRRMTFVVEAESRAIAVHLASEAFRLSSNKKWHRSRASEWRRTDAHVAADIVQVNGPAEICREYKFPTGVLYVYTDRTCALYHVSFPGRIITDSRTHAATHLRELRRHKRGETFTETPIFIREESACA